MLIIKSIVLYLSLIISLMYFVGITRQALNRDKGDFSLHGYLAISLWVVFYYLTHKY